jgi:hypothetical protein
VEKRKEEREGGREGGREGLHLVLDRVEDVHHLLPHGVLLPVRRASDFLCRLLGGERGGRGGGRGEGGGEGGRRKREWT